MKNVTCESKNPMQHCLIGHLHGFPVFLALQVGSRHKGHCRRYFSLFRIQFTIPSSQEMRHRKAPVSCVHLISYFTTFSVLGNWDIPPRWRIRKLTPSLQSSASPPGPASCRVIHGPLLTWLGNTNPREKENGGQGKEDRKTTLREPPRPPGQNQIQLWAQPPLRSLSAQVPAPAFPLLQDCVLTFLLAHCAEREGKSGLQPCSGITDLLVAFC